MEIDVGLDSLALPYDSEAEITAEAARLGYTRIWVGSVADPFQTCACAGRRHAQSSPAESAPPSG